MPAIPIEKLAKDVTPTADVYELLSEAAIAALPSPSWLISSLLTTTGLATIVGAYGTGKSFIAVDMALSIAHGQHWQDRRTKSGSVVYLAGEGVGGLRKRVQAWRQHHDITGNGAFDLIRDTVNLLNNDDVAKLIRTLVSKAPISLLVIDTLARSFVGRDENSAQDMGLFIAACDRIRDATGGMVLIVHHTGKDGGKGARGSTAFMGAVDTSLEVSGSGGIITMKVGKQKDAEPTAPIYLKLTEIDLGTDDDGESMTSCVPVYTNAPKLTGRMKLTDSQQNILEICRQAGPGGIENADWFKAVSDNEITTRRQTFNNTTFKLASMGLVERNGDHWTAVQDWEKDG